MAKENTKAADPSAVDEELVPVECLVSEAGLGMRAGEVRGYPASIAKKMIEKGHAKAVEAVKASKSSKSAE